MDEDWTVVSKHNPTTRRSPISSHLYGRDDYAIENLEETISSLRGENRQLAQDWHRLRIENEGMAREIKGARFLLAKMLETLGVKHENLTFSEVIGSNVREDLVCFQNLTKQLVYAVESGEVQKVNRGASSSRLVPKYEDQPKQIGRCDIQKQSSSAVNTKKIDWSNSNSEVIIRVKGANVPSAEKIYKTQKRACKSESAEKSDGEKKTSHGDGVSFDGS